MFAYIYAQQGAVLSIILQSLCGIFRAIGTLLQNPISALRKLHAHRVQVSAPANGTKKV